MAHSAQTPLSGIAQEIDGVDAGGQGIGVEVSAPSSIRPNAWYGTLARYRNARNLWRVCGRRHRRVFAACRHRDWRLCPLWRQAQDHRHHRGSIGYCQDPFLPGEDRPGTLPGEVAARCACAAVAGQPALNSRVRDSAGQSCLALNGPGRSRQGSVVASHAAVRPNLTPYPKDQG
jgi:hypothetical protein